MTTEERFTRIERTLEFLANNAARHDEQLTKLEQLVNDIAVGTARLLHTAEVHEKRIERLEGNI